MITAAQCRAARGLLRWTQEDLAERSNAGINTIRMFEAERSKPRKSTLKLLQFTFEEAGVQLTDDNGVGVKLRV